MPIKRIRDLTPVTPYDDLYVAAEGETGPTVRVALRSDALPYSTGTVYKSTVRNGADELHYVQLIGPYAGTQVWTRICAFSLDNPGKAVRVLFALSRVRVIEAGTPQIHAYVARPSSGPVQIRLGVVDPVPKQNITVRLVGDDTTYSYSLWVLTLGNPALAGHIWTNISNISYPMDTSSTAPTGPVVVDWATAPQANIISLGSIVAQSLSPASGYIRWDNGWQEAWATVSSDSFSAQTGSGTYTAPYRRTYVWTYPAAFAEAPTIQAVANTADNGSVVLNASTVGSTSATVVAKYPTNNATFTAQLYAVGRWRT